MIFSAFLFEVSEYVPTVLGMYFTGLLLAFVVFIGALFNRFWGAAVLLFAFWVSTRWLSFTLGADMTEAVEREMGREYLAYWNYSVIFSVIVQIAAFVLGLWLRSRYQKGNLR